MNKLAVYVNSFDGYSDIWEPFFSIFFKFWNSCVYPIYLVSNFKIYNDDRVKMLSVGNEINWFDRTINSLEMINEDYIVFLLEDYFLSKNIQNDDFYEIVDFMENNNIIFYQLSSVYGCPKNMKRVKVRSDIKYAINLQPAVWNRKELINILKQINYKTPWDFEYYFARKEYKNKYIHWAVNDTRDILGYKNGVLRGKWFPQTIKYYKKRGIDIDWKQRGKLSIYQNTKYLIAKYLSNHLNEDIKQKIKIILKKLNFNYLK